MVWEGYEMEIGNFQGHEYGIVFPGEMAEGRPYVWRVEFFGAFPAVDLAMLKKGYAVVYYRISDLYGSEEAVRRMAAFQPMVEEKYRLASQAVLFGFSRGGLYALHYAAKYPERAASLYLDAPVVDIYSWPGGFGLSEGAAAEWEECRALWDRTRDEYRRIVDSAIRTLLAWGVPLIMVAGGKDEVVPYAENGAILQAAYEKSSVPFRVIIKPECGHHPHSLDDPDPVAGFLEENRVFPTEGNAFRINDQPAGRHPLVLLVHDSAHAGIAAEAEKIFSGRHGICTVGKCKCHAVLLGGRFRFLRGDILLILGGRDPTDTLKHFGKKELVRVTHGAGNIPDRQYFVLQKLTCFQDTELHHILL